MKQRRLGTDGPWVSAIGLGCSGMSSDYGRPDDAESTATIHRAIELGVTLLDTSDAYGGGRNEELIGRALKGRRDGVFICTKFGNIRGPSGERGGTNSHPDYVPQACEASLRRLGIETIDLLYQHRVDPKVPIADTVGAMSRLVEQGKVRHLGLCEAKLISGKRRGTENIIYLRHLWLDFENGDLHPEEFPALFPHIRMVVTNTFRHTRREPRYRVIIPTTQPMTPEVYTILYESIAFKLEEAGYDIPDRNKGRKAPVRKCSGLDWGKQAPASLFNLPSQAGDPSQSFFHVHTEDGRLTLDPALWVENSGFLIQADVEPLPPSNDRNESVNQKVVEAAIDRWKGSCGHPGEGNDRFFKLAIELRSAGMDMFEIEAILRSEAP